MAYVTAALKSFISIFGKKIKIILAVFAAIAALLLVLALLLGLAHLVQYGLSAKNLNRVGEFIWSLKNNPLKIADAYREWYQVLGVSWEKGDFSWGMAIPFLSPIILGWAIWRALAEFKVFTKLRFRLENHLATENDVRKMGLLNGFLMYLGRFLIGISVSATLTAFGFWANPEWERLPGLPFLQFWNRTRLVLPRQTTAAFWPNIRRVTGHGWGRFSILTGG